jgi:hypothetical protein
MDNENKSWIELLKYPVLILSIVLGLILLDFFLDIDFTRLTKISTSSIEFSTDVNKATSELDDRLTKLELKMDELTKNNKTDTAESFTTRNIKETQIVSDNIAKLSFSNTDNKNDMTSTNLKEKEGYIWIGNYNNNSWSEIQLVDLNNNPINSNLKSIEINTSYRIKNNLSLRDQKPESSLNYFWHINRTGVIPRGTKIRILEEPVAFKRKKAMQYWAKIKVEE